MPIVKNPRTATEAVITANSMVRLHRPGWRGICDHAVAVFYGYAHSGHETAYDHWLAIPASLKRSGDNFEEAPRGALLFWATPDKDKRPGHVTIKGHKRNNMLGVDAPEVGYIGRADVDYPRTHWGYVPLGWAAPYFPNATGPMRTANRLWPEPAAAHKPVPIWYVVERGDSLSSIAAEHDTTLDHLLSLNRPPYRNTPLKATTPIYRGSRVIVGLHK